MHISRVGWVALLPGPCIREEGRVGESPASGALFVRRKDQCSEGAEEDGPRFSSNDDSRVFAVGRFLRRWRIDELPQLVNVLRGEMSLVGPRPERPELAEKLEREIPFYAFRYSVRPGLTGWAQVQFPYCAEPEEHLVKLEFDLYSLRHHGPAMYLVVLLRTLGALIFPPDKKRA